MAGPFSSWLARVQTRRCRVRNQKKASRLGFRLFVCATRELCTGPAVAARVTCAERAEVRKQLEAKSAIMVFSGSKFIGVEVCSQGEATFPVRQPVETAAPLAPVVPIVNGLHVHHCSDAKAMMCWAGAPGQSHCNCVQCLASAKNSRKRPLIRPWFFLCVPLNHNELR